MSTDFTLNAKAREVVGKGASRRLRRQADQVPGIVYGGSKKPTQISVLHKEIVKALENEAFYSHIISLDIDGKAEDVILKDVQRHPAKPVVLHLDFLRVSKTKKLHTRVPLHFINEEAPKKLGGIITHNMTELDIQCLPADLPEFIEVDVAAMEVGSVLHISDLTLPKGVESYDLTHGEDHDHTVVAVTKAKGVAAADDAEESGEE